MDTLLDHEDKTSLQNHANTQTSASVWLAGLWTFSVSAWTVMNFIQLRIATGLIELAGLHRGQPINEFDHFSELPDLEAAFRSATIT